MTVNKERVALWVNELRTTTIPQGRNYLTCVDEYGNITAACCLGIASELARKHLPTLSVKTAFREDNAGHMNRIRTYDDAPLVLPEKVSDWFGFEYGDPSVAVAGMPSMACSALNDTQRWTFHQIADALEATYLQEDK